MSTNPDVGRYGSGRAVRRIEDPALLAGRGQYAGDVTLPGLTWLAFVRSPFAHAKINGIDASAAKSVPGVLAVITGEQMAKAGVKPMVGAAGFKRADGSPVISSPRRALAHEVARFMGEAVALVVAESREAAREGADAVLVDYEELPAVVDTLAALKAGAPVLCAAAPDNIAAEARYGDAKAAEAAFASAAHAVSLDIDNQRLAANPIEPRTVLAAFEEASGRLTVRLSSQMPTAVRGGICDAIPGRTIQNTRVLVGDVGGGFGMKTGPYPEDVAVAYAALQVKRPVRWVSDRTEELQATVHGRDVISRAELALDANGKVLALRVRSFANIGAYATGAGVAIQLIVGPWVSTSIYDIGLIDFHFTAVLTNRAPTGPYRGAGRPEYIYLIERLMDAAARKMRVDPSELRRRNMIRPAQMPYKNPMAQVYDTGNFESIMDQGLALADWNGFAARREESKRRGKIRGRGLATFLEWTGGNALEEKVEVTVMPDGFIEVVTATQQMGQGIQTSYAQLVVDVFEVPIEKIRIVQGDTDRANGFGSAGSRSLFTGGSAVSVGSQKTLALAKSRAAEALEVAEADVEYHAGRFGVPGTDLGVDLFELARREGTASIRIESSTTAGAPSWPNACHVCEVEMDPSTGDVEIVAYASVNDIGRIVSPEIVRGQVEGGAMQGMGQALCERVAYESDSGQMQTASFMDYAMPRVDVFTNFKTAFDTSIPCTTNVLGVKGVGELGTIGATPAVVNAVVDALDTAGLGRDAERIQMPVTAERVWRALAKDFGPSPFERRDG
ncbi:MAG TPA: xanthine dehydrogenase family protein molybdopterin-binding subunit [Usitatibacter sp.]|nr:xanthine dehydrogenase family protein molybdopterin-binding subunit [Usitatibacter sp.]